jgi:Protein of unknown function (DUF2889)
MSSHDAPHGARTASPTAGPETREDAGRGGALPEGAGPEGGIPVHRRTLDFEVFEDEGEFRVFAHLRDERPWAQASDPWGQVHDMELEVSVRRTDLVITEANARMNTYPHAECIQIEPAFAGMVGLTIARGYNRAVQERFGRAKGCTHLEFLARAIGPVIMQALPSAAMRSPARQTGEVLSGSAMSFLGDTCHVWAVGGPGMKKVEAGWRAGRGEYPAPALVDFVRRRQLEADDAS